MPDLINRRKFLKFLGLAGCGLLAAGLGGRIFRNHVGRDFDPQRTNQLLEGIKLPSNGQVLPNIVLILVDDLGYGDLGAYGNKLIRTPNLDRMASQGVLMRCFYACASVCTPSRAAILTGRYAIRTHLTLPLYPKNHPMEFVIKAVGRYRYDVTGIPQDEALLPEILKKSGYRTSLVGKWHLGDQPGHLPNDCGFDEFYGVLYSNDVKRFAVYRNADIVIPEPVDQSILTREYTQEALRFIQENHASPFFLYLSHSAVHEPLFAGEAFRGNSAAGLYGDSVQEVDWSVGQVMEKLADLGLEDKTLVIFTSDNGPWWEGSPGEFRGRKNNITEGGLRVPFIARWDGHIPAGQVLDELCINFDIFPTCLAAVGVDLPRDRIIDGKEMLAVFRGEVQGHHDRFYYYDGPILVAVRYQNWKYHRRHMSDNGGYPLFSQGPFLFDLENDPVESYNLVETFPDIANQLSRMLDDWEAEMDRNVRGWL